MSTQGSWAKIEFPARFLDDDIKSELADYYGHSENGEPDIEDGIFALEDGEAPWGEFPDMEAMLKTKGVPFDRETGADWQCPPCRQIYRPAKNGKPELDEHIQLNTDGEPVVSVAAIREVLDRTDTEESAEENVRDFLNFNYPTYPPLSDWVKAD